MRCVSCCTASMYDLSSIQNKMQKKYQINHLRDVLHVFSNDNEENIFVFHFGVCVFWNVEKERINEILSIIATSSKLMHPLEIDNYEYAYGSSKIQRCLLFLPDKDPMTKLALSYGLAQSAKLSVLEYSVENTISKNNNLAEELSSKGKISLSRRSISKKIGKLFLEKSSVNLNSDSLDEPDFFWEYAQYVNLYKDLLKCLDVGLRKEALNIKIATLGDFLEILNDQLNYNHSSKLELIIVLLIVAEVVITLLKDIFHII